MPYIPPTKNATPISISSILPAINNNNNNNNNNNDIGINSTSPKLDSTAPFQSTIIKSTQSSPSDPRSHATTAVEDFPTPTPTPALASQTVDPSFTIPPRTNTPTMDSTTVHSHSTPHPISSVDALVTTLASTCLSPAPASPPSLSSDQANSNLANSTTVNDLPDLSTSSSSSTSITSDADVSSSNENLQGRRDSRSSASSQEDIENGAYHVEDTAAWDPVKRYRVELYNYTRNLYIEAKIAAKREQRKRELAEEIGGSNNFGRKTSGMERMAAKKALARRLRD